ncbi:MAG: D-Ala-D-Ala carboxypeptidase family metallohydrolase, partial [Candidatus Nanopelagicales bacterium]
PLRERLARPVKITGGYRTPQTNALIGGSKTSQHMVGEAVDIKVGGVPAEDLARAIVDFADDWDQVIWYAPSRGGHVHVSYTESRANRRQTLHAPASGGYSPWRP